MILELLAAAAVGATPPAQPTATPVSPLTVEARPGGQRPPIAATVDVPVDENTMGGVWASVWPADAFQQRINGYVILRCDVDRYGLAEACEVADETPPGKGFGQAALELRPTLKLKPAMGASGPIDAVMNIAIEFKAPDPQFVVTGGDTSEGSVADCGGAGKPCPDWRVSGNPLPRQPVTLLDNPIWTSTASYADLMRAYPPQARGVDGYAVAHCQVEAGGGLSGCQVTGEAPENRGFGSAALRLAREFRVSPEWAAAPHHVAPWVDIPFRFPPPGSAEERTVNAPYWLAGFDPDQALKLFPPEAAARGLSTGRGVVKCVVGQDGSLTNCTAVEADPAGLGFSEAAVRLASTMRMNLWSRDGTPVDGASVVFGVTLKLKSQQ